MTNRPSEAAAPSETPLDVPAVLTRELELVLPWFRQAMDSVIEEMRLPWSALIAGAPGEAVGRLVNQAFNDAIDLLTELRSGRGRAATRTARALFELMIALHDVTSDQEMANRYERYISVADHVRADVDFGWKYLPSKIARSLRHRLNKQRRDSEASLQAAVVDYGTAFRRDWAGLSLSDRATSHGYGAEYAYYRLSSMSVHGSAGGVIGTLGELDAKRIHRLGPDLQSAILAFLKGLEFFRAFVARLTSVHMAPDVTELLAACDSLIEKWPEYLDAVSNLDRGMWPDYHKPGPISILAIDRGGNRRRFIQDTHSGELIDALPPTKEQVGPHALRAVEDMLDRSDPGTRIDEWLTVAMPHFQLRPAPRGKKHPARRFLPSNERMFDEPRHLQPKDQTVAEVDRILWGARPGA